MGMTDRKRRHVDYTDKSDGDEYIEITSLKDIKETSSWDVDVVQSLKITIENAQDSTAMFGQDISLDNYTNPLSLPDWSTDVDICNCTENGKIRTLFSKAAEIKLASSIEEMYVDGFVSSLLNMSGFDDYPCKLYPQYAYRAFFANDHCIGSKADFAVLSGTNKILLIIEDKTTSNATYANNWKQPQVIGEIFVALHKIVASSGTNDAISLPVELYAIRVVSTKFTFYKCSADEDYIKESAVKLPRKTHMKVHRFPSEETDARRLRALDFCETVDRNTILKCMSSIRRAIIV